MRGSGDYSVPFFLRFFNFFIYCFCSGVEVERVCGNQIGRVLRSYCNLVFFMISLVSFYHRIEDNLGSYLMESHQRSIIKTCWTAEMTLF
jgi:hypothetical protein